MANQPDVIPMAWAANNSTADSIPETTSESGKASWDQGFPVETRLPLSQGGVPPKYGDFNGILKILSQFALYAQAGGQYAWSNTLAYGVGSIVLGTDGNLYRAAQESTAVNPVGDASGKWERVVSQSDLASISATAAQAAAAANTAQQMAESAQNAITTLDANVVKKSGDQTIGGVKTFSDNTIFNGDIGSHNINPKQNNLYTLGYASARWKEIWCNQSSLNASSDERIKQQIANIPDVVLDAWGDVDWIQFKYNDACEEKGTDKARLHNGLIAQRVDEAFKAHGLDASKYGLFLYDEWGAQPEEKDAEGNIVAQAKEAGDAYGLRYTEALCMEAAYQRRRADRMVARISEMESRLNEMEAVLASLIAPVGDETFAGSEEGEAQA